MTSLRSRISTSRAGLLIISLFLLASVQSIEAESLEEYHHSPMYELVDNGERDLRLVPGLSGDDASMTIAQAK